MSYVSWFAAFFYKLLIQFYPKSYRTVFAEEMQEVFVQTVSEAAGQGVIRLSFVFLRELKDYPANLVREYWLALQGKEIVMVTGSNSIEASVCPRCGALKPTEARYCTNCGKAFIPFRTYFIEQIRNFFESRITLVVFGALALLVISQGGERLITGGIFSPLSYVILLVGVSLGGFCFGWQMMRKTTNRGRLLLILFVSIYFQLLLFATEKIDWVYLCSEITTGQSISYSILGIQTCVTGLEPENIDDISAYSACDTPNQYDLKLYRRLYEDISPGILIERSWDGALFYPYQGFIYPYQWLFVAYVLGIGFLANRISKQIKRRQSPST
jgi:ribosomal protein L40E